MTPPTPEATQTPEPAEPAAAPTYVTAPFLAKRYDVSLRTIQHWRQTGQLPFVRLPGTANFRYPLEAVEQRLAELTAATPILPDDRVAVRAANQQRQTA